MVTVMFGVVIEVVVVFVFNFFYTPAFCHNVNHMKSPGIVVE